MAAKLQCEICGGKLIGKPGGVFECDSCGMEYDTAWAKAKIQDIQGTVKVEGTVEVQGKVQLEGPVKVEGATNKDSLLKRGNLALEDKDWEGAKRFFNDALNADAECGEAYLGLAIAEAQVPGEAAIETIAEVTRIKRFSESSNYQKAIRFSTDEKRAEYAEMLIRAQERASEKMRKLAMCRERIAPAQHLISVGKVHIVGLCSNGNVLPAGSGIDPTNSRREITGQCNVRDWKNMCSVAAGDNYTIGLRASGGVLSTHPYYRERLDGWESRTITALFAAPRSHGGAWGLLSNGRLICSERSYADAKVRQWTDVEVIDLSGGSHVVCLKTNGKVETAVLNQYSTDYSQHDVSKWEDIVSVAAGWCFTVGLHADGTVVATGKNDENQCCVDRWTDIVAIAAGIKHTVGLHADGTVVATGEKSYGKCNVGDWTNIVAVIAGEQCTIGIRSDGSVVAVGDDAFTLRDIRKWKLFDSIDTLKKARENMINCAMKEKQEAEERAERMKKEAEERAKQERREMAERAEQARKKTISSLTEEKNALNTELSNLKGLFSGKRRKEIEARLAELEMKLKRPS